MPLVREPRICTLTWDEGELAGLTVQLRALHIDHVLTLGELAALDIADLQTGRISPQNIRRVRCVMKALATALVAWDLYEQDPRAGAVSPVPATLAGVRSQGIDFVMEIALTWMSVLGGAGQQVPQVEDDEDDWDDTESDQDELDDEAGEMGLPPDLIAELPMEVLAS